MQHASPLSRRYAGALIAVARDKKALKTVEKDMAELDKMVTSMPVFKTFVNSVVTDEADKMAVVEAITKKAKFHKLTLNFLNVLISHNRLNLLAECIATFYTVLREQDGILNATVTTVQDLSATQKRNLVASLEKMTQHKIVLDTQIDPAILGGMTVTVGSFMIDDSVRGKLARLERSMNEESAAV